MNFTLGFFIGRKNFVMNIDLTQITNITEYLDKLDEIKDKSLILIVVKDNAGCPFREKRLDTRNCS